MDRRWIACTTEWLAGRRGQSGFTLIELLVVIAVLAILATIVIFNVKGVVNRGTNAAWTDLERRNGQRAFYNDNASTRPQVAALALSFRPTWMRPSAETRRTCTATRRRLAP